MVPGRPLEDEFVLTISDTEELLPSEADSDSEEYLGVKTSAANGRKRGREHEQEQTNSKRVKKLKGARSSRTSENEEEEESSIEEHGEDDGAIDPDFEFDFGVRFYAEELENFDVLGDTTQARTSSRGDKKGVDIDEIIARRAAKRAANGTNEESKLSPEELDDNTEQDLGDGVSADDNASQQNVDFKDDELLAVDAFGAGAASDEEEADEIGEEDETEATNHDRQEEGSDTDSVASPIAHPDDLASNASDADSQTSASDPEEAAKRAAFFAPESDTHTTSATKATNVFTTFNLSRPLLRALTTLAFSAPTPIQSRTIPIAMAGHDLVGSAVTGSGKTAAFLLPVLERLLYRPRRIPTTRVSILVPTRELAVQCHAVATQLAKYTDITFALVVGGFSLREQEAVLKRRPDVVIATPGRFIDHMRNSASFTVENVEILILDEADRMLDDGFADELDEILRTIPKSRQTMLFSATMTERIDKLVRVGMNRPVRVSVDKKKATTGGLVQEFVRLRPGREDKRLASLTVLCTNVFRERTIIFFRQKREAHRVRIIFGLLGIKASELHGSMTQDQRLKAVESFRDGRTSHLLATDLASRGLDIKNVATVINYEAPQSHEIYVHRVGRTARAGREGRACTIAAEPDRKVVKAAVKSAREQGAKIVSRALDVTDVDAMHATITNLDAVVEEIMKEEKEEKQLAQAESEVTRGQNMVEHRDEIMSRPKRTWFETEKDKRTAKEKGRAELNAPLLNNANHGRKGAGKLSGKDKKRLDATRERKEGKMWRKGKGSEAVAGVVRKDGDRKREKVKKKMMKRRAKGGGAGKAGGTGKSRR